MKVIFFDIDGTLIKTGGAGQDAMMAAIMEEFKLEGLSGQVPVSGRSDRAITRDLFLEHGIEDSDANWQRFISAYVSGLKANLPHRNGRVLPGVTDLLEQLVQRTDVALGILTGNIRSSARVKLEYFGLDQHFLFGGYGDDHPDRNDIARDAMVAAHRHLDGKFDPDGVWVIGDTPNDVRCARAIQARVLAVATGLHDAKELEACHPDLLLDDLSNPEPFLKLL